MHSSVPRTSSASRIVSKINSRIAGVAAVAFFTCVPAAFAQQTSATAPSVTVPSATVPSPTLDLSHPLLSLQASLRSPLEFPSISSSSSNLAADLPANPGSDLQPPPRRRRYGRPNYSDKYRNADGSNRLAFVAGAGFNVPVGSASTNYLNLGYRFEAGAGINMSSKLGVLFQFDYDHFGIPGNVLANQQALYNSFDTTGQTTFNNLGGNAHIWSFTLNPTFNFYQGDTFGAYAAVGGGYYHKVTNFTIPTTGQAFDPYYGYYQYQANQTIDKYTSNSPGVTGGIGLTYKFSRWSNERLFAEARYVHTFNQARLGDPLLTGAKTGTPNNFYPPNSNETTYIPITVGIRF